jgi:hypothetical protein
MGQLDGKVAVIAGDAAGIAIFPARGESSFVAGIDLVVDGGPSQV